MIGDNMKRKRKSSKDTFLKKALVSFGVIFAILVGSLIFANATSDALDYKDFEILDAYEDVRKIEDEKYLLYFYSEACVYCQQIEQVSLNFFEENKENLPVYLIDADRVRGSKDSLNIPYGESLKSTPTLMVVENYQITKFLVGTEEIKDYYENYNK